MSLLLVNLLENQKGWLFQFSEMPLTIDSSANNKIANDLKAKEEMNGRYYRSIYSWEFWLVYKTDQGKIIAILFIVIYLPS